VPGCNLADENALTREARGLLAIQAEMADLVRLGAYRTGTDPKVDAALRIVPRLEALLRQGKDEATSLEDGFAMLHQALQDGN
jgi:flagellum-specific ATP synthase